MYNQLNLKYFCDKLCAVCILLCVLCMNGLTAHAADNDEIIEFQGDRYVIPDSEMTLLDVLNTCPEYLSVNGKMIDLNYTLRADNINIIVDQESFLANVKACEIDRIQICSNSSVAKAVGGTKGVIDIYYREDVKTDGKVAVAGSTYGNGMVYADVTNRSEKLTVQGYGMVRTSYGKAYPLDTGRSAKATSSSSKRSKSLIIPNRSYSLLAWPKLFLFIIGTLASCCRTRILSRTTPCSLPRSAATTPVRPVTPRRVTAIPTPLSNSTPPSSRPTSG